MIDNDRPHDDDDPDDDPAASAYTAAQDAADALDVPVILYGPNARPCTVWPTRAHDTAA